MVTIGYFYKCLNGTGCRCHRGCFDESSPVFSLVLGQGLTDISRWYQGLLVMGVASKWHSEYTRMVRLWYRDYSSSPEPQPSSDTVGTLQPLCELSVVTVEPKWQCWTVVAILQGRKFWDNDVSSQRTLYRQFESLRPFYRTVQTFGQ